MAHPGVNIYSGSCDPLGAALTFPTELSFKKGKIFQHYPITDKRGTLYRDAEGAYQTLKKRYPQGSPKRLELYIRIATAKFKQHPQLAEAIAKRGGIPWLQECRHQTGALTKRFQWWEGEGTNSPMIRCLIEAYRRYQCSVLAQREPAPNPIVELEEGDVFVFGSNGKGIHGAGAALQAFGQEYHLELVNRRQPWQPGEEVIGKWAIYGRPRGYQEGHAGASYAIETKTDWRRKQSTPLSVIRVQIEELVTWANQHLDRRLLCTAIGCGKAGYSTEAIASLWLELEPEIPPNILLAPCWRDYFKQQGSV